MRKTFVRISAFGSASVEIVQCWFPEGCEVVVDKRAALSPVHPFGPWTSTPAAYLAARAATASAFVAVPGRLPVPVAGLEDGLPCILSKFKGFSEITFGTERRRVPLRLPERPEGEAMESLIEDAKLRLLGPLAEGEAIPSNSPTGRVAAAVLLPRRRCIAEAPRFAGIGQWGS